jgi:hypothetical protein
MYGIDEEGQQAPGETRVSLGYERQMVPSRKLHGGTRLLQPGNMTCKLQVNLLYYSVGKMQKRKCTPGKLAESVKLLMPGNEREEKRPRR